MVREVFEVEIYSLYFFVVGLYVYTVYPFAPVTLLHFNTALVLVRVTRTLFTVFGTILKVAVNVPL